MTERDDDLDIQIAEFVLGTLPSDEREALKARREQDPTLDARILEWESRLSAMADDVEPVEPDPALFARIEQTLGRDDSNVIALRRQVNRWRWSTALVSAAAMVLVAVLTFQPQPEKATESFVAVFQHNDQQPAFLLTVNLEDRQVNIRPVTAEAKPDKSYQLWIKADELGPNPQSVGVLGDRFELDNDVLKKYDPALLRNATFGISVEPPGGSPTGQPTGPAIHGYLYPAGQAPNDNNSR
ncbi:anti-sigma factor [Marinobacter halotolerans]|uniref:anti-sigma factor n=1 Tax=Marinobacter halotolerans TaxID=1569211 RepID=UPI001247146B|nr:anti-sigma factor [Marinobacter halotolerans]